MNSQLLQKALPWLNKVEIAISGLFLLSVYVRSLYIAGSLFFVFINIILLVILHFIASFLPIPNNTTHIYQVVFSKLIRIAVSLMWIGVLFVFLHYKGSFEILIISIISITAGCGGFLLMGIQNFDIIKPFRFDIIRGMAVIMLAVILIIEKNTA